MQHDELKALANIIRHRDAVRYNLKKLIDELGDRALRHDASKLSPEEVVGFARINSIARTFAYGTPEYEAGMASEKGPDGCITLHFGRNSHHPEYHAHERDMGFLDIIEMVLDWKAAADTYGTNTLRDSLPVSLKRFDFSPEQLWLIDQVVEFIDAR